MKLQVVIDGESAGVAFINPIIEIGDNVFSKHLAVRHKVKSSHELRSKHKEFKVLLEAWVGLKEERFLLIISSLGALGACIAGPAAAATSKRSPAFLTRSSLQHDKAGRFEFLFALCPV